VLRIALMIVSEVVMDEGGVQFWVPDLLSDLSQ